MLNIISTDQNTLLAQPEVAVDFYCSEPTLTLSDDATGAVGDGAPVRLIRPLAPKKATRSLLASLNVTADSARLDDARTCDAIYAALRAEVADADDHGVERACAALACARDAIAGASDWFWLLDPDSQMEAVGRMGQGYDADDSDPFWSLLRAVMTGYLRGFACETGWVPQRGVLTDEGPDMSVWLTPNGDYVCDLLVFLSPFDTEDDIWEHASEAFDVAARAVGERLAGIRLISPFMRHLSRFYGPDGSWEYLDDSWLPLDEDAE